MRHLPFDGTFAGFRAVAGEALAANVPPAEVQFASPGGEQKSLFGAPQNAAPRASVTAAPKAASYPPPRVRLPAAYLREAAVAARHVDAGRWDLLYRLAYRLAHGEPTLLEQPYDPDVLSLARLCRAVHREVHKCHAFVRFREVEAKDGNAGAAGRRVFVAWYEPEHDVLVLAAPHFVERFRGMDWSILTPRTCAYFGDGELRFGPGASRERAPSPDALEALWHTYYASIFNPARLNLRATRAEMPRRYWRNLPEAAQIAELRRTAPARVQAFVAAQPPRAEPRAAYPDLAALAQDLSRCQACAWSCQSTQAVAGEGPARAAIMLVGEQPGDVEDVRGRPFVGPAGEVLAEAMQRAGLARADAYLTNAVKHFKFTPRGKRRLHQKPNPTDVAACKGWLAAELRLVQPRVLVCLGTSAALAVRGRLTKLQDVRGQWLELPACARTRVTYHPSAVLRAAPEERDHVFGALVADLCAAREAAGAAPGGEGGQV